MRAAADRVGPTRDNGVSLRRGVAARSDGSRHDRSVSVNDGDVTRPDSWGIHTAWIDAHDEVQHVSAANVRTPLDAIGRPPADLEETAPIVTRPGRRLAVGGEVRCENGT